ncbi:MAG: glutamate--cysteine ligase [Gemmatimonadaceae bacterium]|nr:glutamate--cysteine ligase [Gemmatimonadaceae bacterium]
MAQGIDREQFTNDEFAHFQSRLRENLAALRLVLARPGFGEGAITLGAELELCIVDECGRAKGVNLELLKQHADPQLTLELNAYNLEYNLTPVAAQGMPFGALEQELARALASINVTAQTFDARVIPVGILPTLTPDDVSRSALTDFPRYRALSNGLRRARSTPFPIRIDGADPLQMTGDDITMEGANTSFQVHMRVSPREFAATYNAVQLATPIALAVSGNSPIFCEHRLWEETRVALFKQALDVRDLVEAFWRPPARVSFGHGWVRDGAYELFAESAALFQPIFPLATDEDSIGIAQGGGSPRLQELRLQQGTVWRWNRAVYDPQDTGHLRIEMRALPAGPTPIDMAANAAFLIGLTMAIRDEIDRMLPAFPFEYATWNFYRAAQHGLDARLLWPSEVAPSPMPVSARALIARFLPDAVHGLESLGVDPAEARRLLAVIAGRLDNGQTGARWQRTVLDGCPASLSRRDALQCMMDGYIARTLAGRPVHEWAGWPD